MSDKENLFNEFELTKTQQWEDAIIKSLKGKDYEETVTWNTPEGFSVKPYYRLSDMTNSVELNSTKKDNSWKIRQSINEKTRNKQISWR